MWPFNLSVRLLIVGLVSRYLSNYLIRREPILLRTNPLVSLPCGFDTLCGISTGFPVLSRLARQVAHALLTRPPLTRQEQAPASSVRLECVMHAASVHPEPGSNSRKMVSNHLLSLMLKSFLKRSFALYFSGSLRILTNSFSKQFVCFT